MTRAIDLFSGCGGFSAGVILAGAKVLWVGPATTLTKLGLAA